MPIDQNSLVHDGWVGAEAALPVVEAQDHNRVRVGDDVIGCNQDTSQGWLHPQHVEIVSRDQFGRDEFRLVMPLHTGLGPGGCEQAAEHRVVVAEIAIHGIRERKTLINTRTGVTVEAACGLQNHEAVGVLYRKAAEQGLVEQAEDGGVGADAKCQRDDCHRGKARRFT